MSDIITQVVDASGAEAERVAEVQFGAVRGIPVDWARYQPVKP